MQVSELLTALQGVDPDSEVVYEFGTYEGSVTDTEEYNGHETDGQPVFVIHCEVPE